MPELERAHLQAIGLLLLLILLQAVVRNWTGFVPKQNSSKIDRFPCPLAYPSVMLNVLDQESQKLLT